MPNLARTPPQRVSPLPRSPIPSSSSLQDAPPPAEAGPSTTPAVHTTAASTTSPTRSTRRPTSDAANTSAQSNTSPSRAFVPRNPGVMRSPPAGTQQASVPPTPNPAGLDAVPIGIPNIEVQEASLVDIEMEGPMDAAPAEAVDAPKEAASSGEKRKREDDEDFIEQQVQAGLSTAPAGQAISTTPTESPSMPRPSTFASAAPALAPREAIEEPEPVPEITSPPRTAPVNPVEPRTPSSRTRRRSTRTAAEIAEAESIINAPIEPLESDGTGEYGKRYEITMETLDIASKAAALKWTRKDLEQCFPLISAANPQTMKEVYEDTAKALRMEILNQAKQCFEGQEAGRALKMLDDAVNEAKDYKKSGGGRRADAWRPDLKPHAIVAAANLTIYDDAYAKLRAEYMGLHEDCSARFASIRAKQAELAAFEAGVSDGVVELDKSLDVMDNFPTGEMKDWAERKMSEVHASRAV